ncbi:MAG: Gfo/Idh/MocA family protein [Terriglobia bacterium]
MQPADRPLRAAIVGAGLMGRWHARYATRNRAQVIAIVDPDPVAANRVRASFPAASAFADLATMLAAVTPDVAHICTPVQTHAELVTAALERRVHVMIEKPLAPGAEQTRQLLDIADAAGMTLCPAYQYPFQHGFRHAQEWLRAHGPPSRIDLTICSAGAERLGPRAHEQLVREILPHPISVLCMLTGQDVVDHSRWTVATTAEGEFFACGSVDAVAASICVSTRAAISQ